MIWVPGGGALLFIHFYHGIFIFIMLMSTGAYIYNIMLIKHILDLVVIVTFFGKNIYIG